MGPFGPAAQDFGPLKVLGVLLVVAGGVLVIRY
jgi:uncharacterized membrane protein YdcZ (DUF606 family)